jgi:hypothetical protein
MDCKKGTAFLFYPKIVGCGKKQVAEQFGLKTAVLELWWQVAFQ